MRFTEVSAHKSYAFSKDEVKHRPLFSMAEKIWRDCKPYLKQNSDALNVNALYRGVKNTNDELTIHKQARLDFRDPTDMNEIIHKFYNTEFQKLYGAAFRNAVFVSGSAAFAGGYGDAYIIFPIGDFQYIWSDTVEDLYVETQETAYDKHYVNGMDEHELKNALVPGTELYNDLYHGLLTSYQSDELEKGIRSNHEIMIRTSSYYGIHSDVRYNGQLMKELKVVMYS